ncbi:hypothetical protein Purlil1_4476 [Purpureocillium lilacinum]|uniref:Uncharacterized protein n=1 Tax=Purpureocillium lilacinum TaxID=33203 RepID=A0ABR0C3B9_PURLI|nr:hypothetical protein Purlil1_4476 [Purpureocillium lilacinum]
MPVSPPQTNKHDATDACATQHIVANAFPRRRRYSSPVCNITNYFNSVTGCVCLGLVRRGYPGYAAMTAVTPGARHGQGTRQRDPDRKNMPPMS